MNAITERWIPNCRHELLDRTLIRNQQHLLHALREYEKFFDTHRGVNHLGIRRRQRLRGILDEYHHAA
ncbi:hypothetical protein [Actinosynnema sp. NPDC023587]|uniref:hypothetical protein n=1 Tax=Actinosynnema sp. NPDC023587 TaxID=3154695 RepID=UPI0033F9893A